MRRCPFQRTLRSNRPPRHPHPKGTLSKEPSFSAERARRSILRTWRRFPLCRCPIGCCRCHRQQGFDRRSVSCRRCNSNKAGGRRSLRQRGQINAPFSVESPAFSALLLHLRQIKFGNQRFNHGPDIIPHPQKLPFVVQVKAVFDK